MNKTATTDLIANFIQSAIDASTEGFAELQRSALAEMFSCVPSQINYVLSTRFSPERGFSVESRRGGGGYIRIAKVHESARESVMNALDSLGDAADATAAETTLRNLSESGVLDKLTARMMIAASGNSALKGLEGEQRDQIRASILKHMLVSYVSE